MDSQIENLDNLKDENTPKCDICCESYENTKNTLDCGHSFCRECIVNMINSPDLTISCPLCRKISNINLINITKSVNNPEELIELFKKLSHNNQKQILCDNCHTINAEHSCFECDVKLCEKCWPDIHKIGRQLQHKKNNLFESNTDSICPHHPKYYREFICMHDDCLQI